MNETLSISVYIVGWLLFVWLQAHNSVLSKTNSLEGWAGYKLYLKTHAPDLAVRAFFSALGYGFIVHSVATTVQAVGFTVTGTAIAGVGGFTANTACYQFMGIFPALRKEVADVAPPPTVSGVAQAALPKPPETP